jgi:hypothetical protein
MKLQGDQGITLELDAVGYQFPEAKGSHLDWLIIQGRVELPHGTWSFSCPCLTILEVERLTRWFEAIEEGSDLIRPATFIEPNLEFSYMSLPPAAVQIRLTRECAPPWLTDKNQRSEGIVMSFSIGTISLPAIVSSLPEWLARYPARASGGGVT